MTPAGSYHKSRAYVPYGTSTRIISHEPTYLPLRASQVTQRGRQGGLQPAAVHRLGQASGHPAHRCPSGASRPHRCKRRRHCPRSAKCKEKLKKQPQNLAIANYFGNFASQIVLWCNGSTTDSGPVCLGSSPSRTTVESRLFWMNGRLFLCLILRCACLEKDWLHVRNDALAQLLAKLPADVV